MLLICLQSNAEQLQNAVFCYTHEGNDTGELQPHQGGGAADCRRRVAAHPVRPGTATPLAGQVKNATGEKRKIRNSAVLFRPGYGFSLIMKNAPQVCCLAARLGGLLSFSL